MHTKESALFVLSVSLDRVQAKAKLLGTEDVPSIETRHLTDAQLGHTTSSLKLPPTIYRLDTYIRGRRIEFVRVDGADTAAALSLPTYAGHEPLLTSTRQACARKSIERSSSSLVSNKPLNSRFEEACRKNPGMLSWIDGAPTACVYD